MTTDHVAEIATALENVERWRARAANIHSLLAEAGRVAVDAEPERLALAARMAEGDPKAAGKLDALRKARIDAEAKIADLQTALQHAEAELKAAEAAHAQAVKGKENSEARAVADRRIAVAERFDAAIADLEAAYVEWQALGRDLASRDLVMWAGPQSLSAMDSATGYRRPAHAFARFASKVFPESTVGSLGNGTPLAVSEAGLWRDLRA